MKRLSTIFQLVLILMASQSVIGATHIESPEWSFTDDFEGSENSAFWKGGPRVQHGAQCTSDPNASGEALVFTYNVTVPEGAEWSERRFRIPINARQIEISYDLFVPANYVHVDGNHKGVINFWSGTYGTVASNITVTTENWPRTGGATPSIHIGVDGTDNGHYMLATKPQPLMLSDGYGKWQRIDVYLELAQNSSDYGVFEIYKDGRFITGTHHPDIERGSKTPPIQQIKYSTRGNYIDQGYLLGWANNGFKQTTIFCIDNFSIKASSSVGSAYSTSPREPTELNLIAN